MDILILSRSDSVHADAVEEYCLKRASVSRMNFDFETSGLENLPRITARQTIPEQIPDAVFVHHPRISYSTEAFTDILEQKLFVASWDSVKEWLEVQFSAAHWINRPSSNRLNRNVLHQLRLADSLGFDIPETLFTNDKEELLRFSDGEVIVIKQGNLGVHLNKKRILTSIVNIADIEPEILRHCPCLFQKYILKQHELRVHVIGENVLTCKIHSQVNEKTCVDWRNYDLDNTPHEACDLGDKVEKKCVEIVRQLGLEFGVIDIIVTPREELVFLECNAQGHWIWIEKLTGLPITKTLCEYILTGSA